MTTAPLLLGLIGRPMAGKDTVAAILRADGWHSIAFADALRIEVAEAFRIPIEMLTDPRGKHSPARCLAAGCCHRPDWLAWCDAHDVNLQAPRSPRWIMQRWGTEFRRAQDDRHWTRQVRTWISAQRYMHPDRSIVVTDVRMPNEAVLLHELGGVLVRIYRPEATPLEADTAHRASEAHDSLPAHADLHNDGSVVHLAHAVRRLVFRLAYPGWPAGAESDLSLTT